MADTRLYHGKVVKHVLAYRVAAVHPLGGKGGGKNSKTNVCV